MVACPDDDRLSEFDVALFTVADLHGPGDIAQGELMRFFAETAWYPTALLWTARSA
jgi:hypothetical protein